MSIVSSILHQPLGWEKSPSILKLYSYCNGLRFSGCKMHCQNYYISEKTKWLCLNYGHTFHCLKYNPTLNTRKKKKNIYTSVLSKKGVLKVTLPFYILTCIWIWIFLKNSISLYFLKLILHFFLFSKELLHSWQNKSRVWHLTFQSLAFWNNLKINLNVWSSYITSNMISKCRVLI